MYVFATLRLLRSLLEPILAPRKPIWSQKGTPKFVQKCSKKCPKTGPKNDSKNNQKIANFGPQNGVQNGPRWRSSATGKFSRTLSWKLLDPGCPKMAHDTPKMAQEGPKMLQDGPKMAHLLKEKPKRGNWVALGLSGLLQAAMGCLRLPCATLRFTALL